MFLCSRISLRILLKAFHQKLICVFAQSAKVMKWIYFLKKTSTQSSWDVKLSFDKPAGNFRQEAERFFARTLQTVKIYMFFFPNKNPRMFLWTLKKQC